MLESGAALLAGDPVLLVVAGLLLSLLSVLILGLMCGYYSILAEIASFVYPVARARARGNPWMKREKLEELLGRGSIPLLLGRLRDQGMELPLESAIRPGLFDRALESELIRDISLLAESSPGSVRPFFAAWVMTLEAVQLKKAIRILWKGLPQARIEQELLPVGRLDTQAIRRLSMAGSLEGCAALLEGTRFGAAIAEAIPAARAGGSPVPLEIALDRAAFRELQAAAETLEERLSKPLRAFTGAMVDAANIRTLLRGELFGLPAEEIERQLIPGGRELTIPNLLEMYRGREAGGIASGLERTPYREIASAWLSAGRGARGIEAVERELDRLLLSHADELAVSYQFGGGPLLKYAFARGLETRNIRAIWYGILAEAGADRIRSRWIVEV